MEKAIDTDEMILMIEMLLSTSNNGTYVMESIIDKLTIKFTGDCYKVQSEVLKWLNSPDRLNNIKTMEKIRTGKS